MALRKAGEDMKHIHKAEQKCSETAFYRYVVGFAILFLEALKSFGISVLRHITELLIVFAFVGMFTAGQAFESNAINYTVCILFILILAILIVTLIKIKIFESRGDKK